MDEQLTSAQVADRLGIERKTWNAYVSRSQAPAADGWYDGRTPWWRASTIDSWKAARPGRGGPGRPRSNRSPAA